MAAKLVFDEITKIITVTLAPDASGEIYIDVKTDLYSDGKEDWVNNENLRKFVFPVRSVGGDDLPGSKALGATFFLASDWKIRPYEASHKLIVNGNLYSEDGSDPFLDTLGTYTVRIIQQVSSLVDSTVQQLEEIEYASFGDGVSVDIINGVEGINYPAGNQEYPCINLANAVIIANNRGFKTIFIRESMTLNNATDVTNFTLAGRSHVLTIMTIDENLICTGLTLENCNVTGILDGGTHIYRCSVGDINYVNGHIHDSGLYGEIILGGNEEAVLANCFTIDQDNPLIVDMGGSGQDLAMPNYSGLVTVKNLNSASEEIGIGLNAGMVVLEPTIVSGTIIIAGNGMLMDYSGDGAYVNSDGLMSKETISSAIYETIGEEIQYASYGGGVSIDTINGVSGTVYNIGTIENPVNNLIDGVSIANTRGFNTFFINDSTSLDSGTDINSFKLVGKSHVDTIVTMESSAQCENIIIENCNINGILDGGTHINRCSVGDINYVNGHIHESGLYGTIVLGGNEGAIFTDCFTPDQDSPPIIDMGGSGQDLSMPNYSGLVTVKNLSSASEEIGIGLNAGMVVLEDTIVSGTIIIAGNGMLMDYSGPGTYVNTDGLMSKETITKISWDAVYLDTSTTNSGIVFPVGTMTSPSNNIIDACMIANNNNIKTLKIRGSVSIPHICSGWTFIGLGSIFSDIINLNNQSFTSCRFDSLTVSGTMTATDIQFIECNVIDVTGMNALIMNSSIQGSITMGPPGSVLTGQDIGVRGNTVGVPAVVDMVGTGRIFQASMEGAIQFSNMAAGSIVEMGLKNGTVILDPTCMAGDAIFTGVGDLINYSTVSVMNSLLTETSITESVWDEQLADHKEDGSFGGELATKADIASSSSTDSSTTTSGSVIYGTEDSGTYLSTNVKDNTYWEIEENSSTGLTTDLIFNIPDNNRAGVFRVFGRYEGTPGLTHYIELWVYNYEASAWEQLIEEFLPGGNTSDAEYSHEYFERNIDRTNNNEVKIRLIHNVTTYNNAHHMFLDFAELTSIDVITAADIADAVWDEILVDHDDVGSTGEALGNISGGSSPAIIADAVLDELLSEHTISGSFGYVVNEVNEDLKRTLGLLDENSSLDQQVYNVDDRLLSARKRTYSDKDSVGTDNDVIATYNITSTWSGNQLTSYKMVKA